jgi:SAM-dependent methyltransferase
MAVVPKILYLSPPAQVSMAEHWFEIAPLDHFWVRRRFEVFQRLAGGLVAGAREIAEIGCGHGLVQRQVEDAYNREVSGFDLNEFALKRNLSRRSAVCCYDICQRNPQFHERFDLIFLFDVLEHIDDEDQFLQAIMFHMAPGGSLVVNVPAGQWMYSAYDRADGHKRRYSIRSLRHVAARNNLDVAEWCYWGFPLLPAVMLRRFWLAGKRGEAEIISAGFPSPGRSMNRLIAWLYRCEPTPQKLLGTSIMAVLKSTK